MLVIGSGNVVHNLGAVDQSAPDEGFAWARRFDEAARGVLQSGSPADVAALDGHADFADAVPTPDHYLPLLYIAGLAGDEPMSVLVDGHQGGSLSMAAYTVGLRRGRDRVMNAVTVAGVISTLLFLGSNLPMVVQRGPHPRPEVVQPREPGHDEHRQRGLHRLRPQPARRPDLAAAPGVHRGLRLHAPRPRVLDSPRPHVVERPVASAR